MRGGGSIPPAVPTALQSRGSSTSLHCLAVRFTLGNPRMNVTREADESYTMKASWVKRTKNALKNEGRKQCEHLKTIELVTGKS